MRIHKYFRRSFTRLHTSSTSFSSCSSFSSSSSSPSSSSSFSATTDGETTKDTKPTKRKRLSWWKRRSFRVKLRKRKERKQSHDKPEKENNNDEEKSRHNVLQTPPISELDQALARFGIATQEDFNPVIVKKRYKKLCLIHHPDRNNNKEESIHKMQTINHYFDLLQEELRRLEHPSEREEDPLATFSSSKKRNKHSKHNKHSYRHRRSSHKSRRNSVRRSKTKQDSCPWQTRNSDIPDTQFDSNNRYFLDDPLLDVGLSFLVGRFVIGTGWFASAVLVGLAHFAGGNFAKSKADLSKSLFFALGTGWYLLWQLLAKSQSLLLELPWQLWVLGLSTVISSLMEDRQTPLPQCLANTVMEAEASLISAFDWILSNHTLQSDTPLFRTIADFGVLSIAFLSVKLICSTF